MKHLTTYRKEVVTHWRTHWLQILILTIVFAVSVTFLVVSPASAQQNQRCTWTDNPQDLQQQAALFGGLAAIAAIIPGFQIAAGIMGAFGGLAGFIGAYCMNMN